MTVAMVVLGFLVATASAARWFRVAQREHYLAGSCWSTALRWVGCRPPNAFVAIGLVAGVSVAVVAGILGAETTAALAALWASILGLLFPWGMPVLGSPLLRLTRRARTLVAVFAGLVVVTWLALGLLVGGIASTAVTVLAVPVLVDAALALSAPFERRALERHRARAQRRLNDVRPFVIAVTGSWGKTSTKNHIRDLLTGAVEVVASPASWNNTAGLSRTMNEYLTDGTEVLVAEMGMYGPGEIRSMCSWVKPDVGVICSIGPMHLERVGSLEGIAQAKAEILENVETAVLWVDDPRLSALADSVLAPKVWRVGSKGTGPLDVEVSVDEGSGDMSVLAGNQLIGVCPASSGAHPGNIGCAVAAALAVGTSVRQIADRLSVIASPDHRATTVVNDSGVLVVDDTFNSNPVGALAAVGVLERTVAGRRAVVTPGMVELGPVQVAENGALARAVVASGATLVVVGWTNRRALVSGAAGSAVVVSNRESAAAWVREQLHQGDGVLWENDLPDHYP